MIASILIPSRQRPEGLLKTVESFMRLPTDKFEVMVKLDEDDPTAPELSARLSQIPNVSATISPSLNGYSSLEVFFTEMSGRARGRWIWPFNDDATIDPCDWEAQLEQIPTTGFIVQSEYVTNNHSMYRFCEGGPFPLVPNRCWEKFGLSAIQAPADTALDQLLRVQNGWKTHFLTGVVVRHNRIK